MFYGNFHSWVGQTGNKYVYLVIPFPIYACDIPDFYGNYIFTRKDGVKYTPIYFGKGELREIFKDSYLIKMIFTNGVNQVHIHYNEEMEQQEKEANDIIRHYFEIDLMQGEYFKKY